MCTLYHNNALYKQVCCNVSTLYTLQNMYVFLIFSDDLIVTSGASQGLSMLAGLFFSPGDLVFVEDPTYFIALRILQQDHGLKCVPSRRKF